jgi:NAD(P)-dependent dehydrogenase (short-subunit alcohol dehydrogenase family)
MASAAGRLADRIADRVVNPRRLTDRGALRKEVEGKVVLVTGASFGLGEATARRLGAAGATVLLVARTADRLEALADEINAVGGTAFAYPADLSDEAAVTGVVERILTAHGGVDIVINNAGKSVRRSLHLQYDRFHDFTRLININYLGPVRLLLGLLPHMRERGSGLIVNVSTVGVRLPPAPRWGAYQASKAAFDVWLRSVTPELQADGVDVSTIYMGLMYTRMSAPTASMQKLPGLTPEQAAELVSRAIVRREAEIEAWWMQPTQITTRVLRRPLAVAFRIGNRFTKDTDSALGRAALPADHPKNGRAR